MGQLPDDAEIKRTIFQMGSFKAPGPDGFPALFYKKFWHVVGKDVMEVVKEFFKSGCMSNGLNSTHLVLIPKVIIRHLLIISGLYPSVMLFTRLSRKLLRRGLNLFLLGLFVLPNLLLWRVDVFMIIVC